MPIRDSRRSRACRAKPIWAIPWLPSASYSKSRTIFATLGECPRPANWKAQCDLIGGDV